MTQDRSLARHKRIYRTLLLLYPRAFRQVFGADMVQVFGDMLREERERSRPRASTVVWLRTLLDLFKTAPLQRMEKPLSREVAFGILFVLGLAFAPVAMTLGFRSPGISITLGALVAAGIGLVASGSFRKKNAMNDHGAERIGLREWWVVLAAIMGVFETLVAIRRVGISQLVVDHKIEDAVGLTVLVGSGLLAVAGSWFRFRSRGLGDWLMVVGLLPYLTLFWLIYPPILATLVMTMALIDRARGRLKEASVA